MVLVLILFRDGVVKSPIFCQKRYALNIKLFTKPSESFVLFFKVY
jgi:hypothetical protein